jgi:hypothetical protein
MSRSITKYDTMFLTEILIAFILNHLIVNLSITVFLILTLTGLFFEIFTRSFWTYSKEFKQSIFTIHNTDVSISAAFSWAAVIMICINLSALTAGFVDFPHKNEVMSIAIMGIGGNCLETICARWGMFTYDESWITRMIFCKKSIYLWDVPLLVRIGYFVIFGVLSAILLYLSKII